MSIYLEDDLEWLSCIKKCMEKKGWKDEFFHECYEECTPDNNEEVSES